MHLIGLSRFFVGTSLLMVASLATAELKRTAAGHPDLTGTYDSGTLTPQERPEVFGDKQFMSREEADLLLKAHPFTQTDANEISDPNRVRAASGWRWSTSLWGWWRWWLQLVLGRSWQWGL